MLFSVAPAGLHALIDYIDTQEQHHSTRRFQDEYRDILTKHEINYDERDVWD